MYSRFEAFDRQQSARQTRVGAARRGVAQCSFRRRKNGCSHATTSLPRPDAKMAPSSARCWCCTAADGLNCRLRASKHRSRLISTAPAAAGASGATTDTPFVRCIVYLDLVPVLVPVLRVLVKRLQEQTGKHGAHSQPLLANQCIAVHNHGDEDGEELTRGGDGGQRKGVELADGPEHKNLAEGGAQRKECQRPQQAGVLRQDGDLQGSTQGFRWKGGAGGEQVMIARQKAECGRAGQKEGQKSVAVG